MVYNPRIDQIKSAIFSDYYKIYEEEYLHVIYIQQSPYQRTQVIFLR